MLADMLRPLQRHAWYHTQSYLVPTDLLGMGRVTLGFVNRAVQPAVVAGGEVVVMMDGELYDPELLVQRLQSVGCEADADAHAELLALAWHQFGSDGLSRLAGSFTAAIWDVSQRRLTLCNDRFGTRPLYYASLSGSFLFASSLTSLMASSRLSREPNHRGLAQFFTFGHYLGTDTSLRDVRVLTAGARATIEADALVLREVSQRGPPSGSPGEPATDQVWTERIDLAFAASVSRCAGGTRNLGLSLSGGLDARCILGLIDCGRTTLKTVCLGMPGSLDHQSSERLAQLAGCEHHNHVLGAGFLSGFREHLEDMVALTDGQYLSQCIVMPTLPVYRDLGIEVLLRGHAGELMHMRKAYNYSLDNDALAIRSEAELESWLSRRLQAYMLEGVEKPLFRSSLQSNLAELAQESLRADLQSVSSIEPPLQRIWHLFVRQRLRRETVLSLVKFRSVVETRLPYLDSELIDLLLAAPPYLKVDETLQTYILRKRKPAFLKVVNANTGARMGAGKLQRTLATAKMKVCAKLGVPGYQPYERLGLWLRRELAPTVREILLSSQCLDNGVFEADGVRHVVSQHLEQGRNHTFLIMALMIYELGRRRMSGTLQR